MRGIRCNALFILGVVLISTCVGCLSSNGAGMPAFSGVSEKQTPEVVIVDTIEVSDNTVIVDGNPMRLLGVKDVCGHWLHLYLGSDEIKTIISVPQGVLIQED